MEQTLTSWGDMKKLILATLLLLLTLPVNAANLLDRTEDTTPTADDMMYCVNAPGGTPADRKCTVGNVAKGMTVTNMISACTDAQVLGGTAAGTGVECQADMDTTCDAGSCTITNAGTAAALAANGANCSAGSYPLGVDAAGAVESCTDATTEINTEIGNVLDGTDTFTDMGGTNFVDDTHIDWGTGARQVSQDDIIGERGGCSFTVCASDAQNSNCDYVCDGTADDVQFQAAHDATSADGGRICLTEGTFVLAATVSATKKGITFIGAGPDSTTVQLANSGDTDMFDVNIASDEEFYSLQEMTIDLNRANNTTGRALYTGTGAGDMRDVYIRHVFVTGGNPEPEIQLSSGWGALIVNSVFEYGDGDGIQIDGAGDPKIMGCKIIENAGKAIDLANSGITYAKIIGNHLEGGASDPALYIDGQHAVIQGNTIIDSGEASNVGIQFVGDFNIMTGNRIVGTGTMTSGVILDSGADGNYVAHNKLTMTAGTEFTDNGANNILIYHSGSNQNEMVNTATKMSLNGTDPPSHGLEVGGTLSVTGDITMANTEYIDNDTDNEFTFCSTGEGECFTLNLATANKVLVSSGTSADWEFTRNLFIQQDNDIIFSEDARAKIRWDQAGTNDSLQVGVGVANAARTGYMTLLEVGDMSAAGREPTANWIGGAVSDNPAFCVASADATAADEVLCEMHNGTDGYLAVASGDLNIAAQGGDVDFNDENITTTGIIKGATLNATGLTASEIVITDASKNIVSGAVATYPSLAELAYVKDVTSAIQTQLNAKDAVTTAGDYLTRTTNDFDADAELYTITKCAVIETPTDADNFLIYHVELGMQVTAVHCIVEAATSATIEIEQCDVAGDNCTAVTTALVCDVGGQADDGTIDAPDLDVDDWVRLDVTATSGTPGHVTACFTATMDD